MPAVMPALSHTSGSARSPPLDAGSCTAMRQGQTRRHRQRASGDVHQRVRATSAQGCRTSFSRRRRLRRWRAWTELAVRLKRAPERSFKCSHKRRQETRTGPKAHVCLRSGGSGEIRTHGRLPVAGFQDRCNRPLCHASGAAAILGGRRQRGPKCRATQAWIACAARGPCITSCERWPSSSRLVESAGSRPLPCIRIAGGAAVRPRVGRRSTKRPTRANSPVGTPGSPASPGLAPMPPADGRRADHAPGGCA
jgi:hypothetical protein